MQQAKFAIILGWMGTILCPIVYITTIHNFSRFNANIYIIETLASILEEPLDAESQHEIEYKNVTRSQHIILAFLNVIGCISSIFLLFGVYQKKAVFIKSYLGSTIAIICLGCVDEVLYFISVIIMEPVTLVVVMVGNIAFLGRYAVENVVFKCLFLVGFSTYAILSVHGLYSKVLNGEQIE